MGDSGEVIPFGKYKGQAIREVIQRDPQYVHWIMQQAWFAEKFAPIYQVVVNNFSAASEDTPAHNALQVRFLREDFCRAVWRLSWIDVGWGGLEERWARATAPMRTAPRPFANWGSEGRQKGMRTEWRRHMFAEHRERVRAKWRGWRAAHRAPWRGLTFRAAEFETGFDVEFRVIAWLGHEDVRERVYASHRVTIELKPSLGDDYPAVLRQMKRQIAADRPEVGADHTHRILLVDEFASSTVTLVQVSEMFAAAGIDVMLLREVREKLIEEE